MILVLSLSVFFIKFFTFIVEIVEEVSLFYTPGPPLSMPPSLQPAQAVKTDPTRKGGTPVHLLGISLG